MRKKRQVTLLGVVLLGGSLLLVSCDAITAQKITQTGTASFQGMNGGGRGNGGFPGMNGGNGGRGMNGRPDMKGRPNTDDSTSSSNGGNTSGTLGDGE